MTNLPIVSILGCGWYGLPLGRLLVKNNFTVKGSTTNSEKIKQLESEGIQPFLIHLPHLLTDLSLFLNTNILVLNLPPTRQEDSFVSYLKIMDILLKELTSRPQVRVLFISSTSVYPDYISVATEDITIPPNKTSGKTLIEAENKLLNLGEKRVVILRFAGLIGADRNPGRFLAEKKKLKDGFSPVNLVHLEDCLSITFEVINKSHLFGTYNVCCDEHPLRKDFYTFAAQKSGLTPPEFLPDQHPSTNKIISNAKIKKALHPFQFIYPSPYDAI